MAEPTKKSSPFPIAKATELPDAAFRAERPLSPIRRLALPIGVAASLVLAGAGVGAYAYAASSKTPASPDDTDEGCPTRSAPHATASDFFSRTVARAKAFLDPSPPPRMAGEMSVVLPPIAPASASVPTPTPNPPILPSPDPTPLPGKRSAPSHVVPTTKATVESDPSHPKLGGKPTSTQSI